MKKRRGGNVCQRKCVIERAGKREEKFHSSEIRSEIDGESNRDPPV